MNNTNPSTAPLRHERGAHEIFEIVMSTSLPQRALVLADLCRDQPELLHPLRELIRVAEEQRPTLAPKMCIGRYVLKQRLGEGSTAEVWVAHDKKMRRDVALKVFSANESREHWAAVIHEARAVTDVESHHLVHVHDVSDEEDDYLFIDMHLHRAERDNAYVYAKTAAHTRPLSLREAVSWIEQAARGVHAAHSRRVFHRDLKPENILIEPQQRGAKVMDFGLAVQQMKARHTPNDGTIATVTIVRTGTVFIAGTPPYMAPEQARGTARPLSADDEDDCRQLRAMDVYGLGATLYALLAGEPPFVAEAGVENPIENVLHQAGMTGPIPLQDRVCRFRVPASIARIVMRAMSEDPSRRHVSAAALADELAGFLAHRAPKADRWRLHLRSTLWMRRHWSAVSVSLTLGLLSAGAIGLNELRHEAQIARAAEEDAKEGLATALRETKLAIEERDEAVGDSHASRGARETAERQSKKAENERKTAQRTRDKAERAREDADAARNKADAARDDERRERENAQAQAAVEKAGRDRAEAATAAVRKLLEAEEVAHASTKSALMVEQTVRKQEQKSAATKEHEFTEALKNAGDATKIAQAGWDQERAAREEARKQAVLLKEALDVANRACVAAEEDAKNRPEALTAPSAAPAAEEPTAE